MVAAVTAASLIAQQVSGKAIRDALFLSTFAVKRLPLMMSVAAAISLVAVLGLSRLLSRKVPAEALPVIFAVNAICMALAAVSFRFDPRVAAVLVYLAVAIFGPVVMSAFWSVVNERFDPHAAKKEVSRIASGGTTGGFLGGLAAWRLSSHVSLAGAIVFLAMLNMGCVVGAIWLRNLGRREGARPRPTLAEPTSGGVGPLQALREAPFLCSLAALVALGSVSSTLLDFTISASATLQYGDGPSLLAFFSLFGVAVSALSLFVQLTLGRFAIEKLGLVGNVLVLQVLTFGGSALALLVPGLPFLATLRGTEMVHRNTLFRSAYELFYTPVPESRKRVTKAIIDVGFDRLGTVLGSGITFLVLWRSQHAEMRLLWVVIGIAIVTIVLGRFLHTGYIGTLAASLKEGAARLAIDHGPVSARTEALEERGREHRIERVEAIRHPEDGQGPRAAKVVLAHRGEIAKRAAALLGGDPAKIRAALAKWEEHHVVLVPLAVAHLSSPEVSVPARMALRGVAAHAVGALADVLLDSTTEFAVRQRVAAVLGRCTGSQRAADTLVQGLGDARFEVRYACGRALLRITEVDAATGKSPITMTQDLIVRLVQDELERITPEVLELVEDAEEDDEESSPAFSLVQRDRVGRQLEHIFVIVALTLEREPLRLAFDALQNADARHRGTALEYIQTALPAEIRAGVWPLLETGADLLATPRDAAIVFGELSSLAEKVSAVRVSQEPPPEPADAVRR